MSDGIHFRREALRAGLWLTLYDALLPFIDLLIRIVALFHVRLKRALQGRSGGLGSWKIDVTDDCPAVLIHTSSRGELEGAIPLINRLIKQYRCRVAVSFSSPSVEKMVADMPGIWAYGYMPLDYIRRQVQFLGTLEPSVILIFKHDFWPNTIRAADALEIPVILVNANFHPKSKRMMPVVRSFNRAFMKPIKAVWTVSEDDARRIEPLLSVETELEAVGDTRYDRVRRRAHEGAKQFQLLKEALGTGPVMILGSSWQPGERICWEAFAAVKRDYPTAKMVVAPHELTKGGLNRNLAMADRLGLTVRLMSEWKQIVIEEDVLLVDRMGVLAGLYSVGWAAYVGGGFGVGVHSVIEPAAHGIPVMFGPNYHVSNEATLLLKAGGGFVVETAESVERLWRAWLGHPDEYRMAADLADSVVSSREGVVDRLMEKLKPYIPAEYGNP